MALLATQEVLFDGIKRIRVGRPSVHASLKEIVRLRLSGRSWREIGAELEVSPRKLQKIVLSDLSTARMLMPDRHPRGDFVYFVLAEEANAVKIGYTGNLQTRFNNLQNSCPFQLKLIGALYWRENLEQELHALFAEHRMHGEWFRFSDEIKNFLASSGGAFTE